MLTNQLTDCMMPNSLEAERVAAYVAGDAAKINHNCVQLQLAKDQYDESNPE